MKVVVISVPLQGRDAIQMMLWISLNHLPFDGFTEILATALCLTANKSDTAWRFISHEDSEQRFLWKHNIMLNLKDLVFMLLVGIDVAKDKHDCFIQTSDGKVLYKSFTVANNYKRFEELCFVYSGASCQSIFKNLYNLFE